jgi:hypothetical protein
VRRFLIPALLLGSGLCGIGSAGRADIVGTAGQDRLRGTTQPDELYGLGGRDRIEGRAASDMIDGGAGRDRSSPAPEPNGSLAVDPATSGTKARLALP